MNKTLTLLLTLLCIQIPLLFHLPTPLGNKKKINGIKIEIIVKMLPKGASGSTIANHFVGTYHLGTQHARILVNGQAYISIANNDLRHQRRGKNTTIFFTTIMVELQPFFPASTNGPTTHVLVVVNIPTSLVRISFFVAPNLLATSIFKPTMQPVQHVFPSQIQPQPPSVQPPTHIVLGLHSSLACDT